MEAREEYVRKLKLELEEKYQETLKTERQSWLQEQAAGATQQAEKEVMLARSTCDTWKEGAAHSLLVSAYFSSLGWPGTRHVDQSGLKLRDLPASAS